MITLPRNAHVWLPDLVRRHVLAAGRRQCSLRGAHVMFAIADHYEPFNGGVSLGQADRRVDRWQMEYARTVEGLRDADGQSPQHSFFYPLEQYDPGHVEKLASLVERGCGEIEVHLHHDEDTSANLRRSMVQFTNVLRDRHGLLTKHPDGSTAYGFVHGNWALDNARPDGRHCGVNDELTILRQTGCYADFTLPGVPDVSQTRTVNSIYYAVDDPARPKSHDRGMPATVGRRPPADGLLMVQGPLGLDWTRRKYGVLPGVESGTLDDSTAHLPDGARFSRWLAASVQVEGRPDWIFVKVHTHGAPEPNAAMLLGPAMRQFHMSMQHQVRQRGMHLHYVTAREMANIVRAAENGATGNPEAFRDYWLPPPARLRRVRTSQTRRFRSALATASEREWTCSFS
jgi:hypothetical protein